MRRCDVRCSWIVNSGPFTAAHADPRLFSQPSGPENLSTGFSDRGRQVSGKAGPMVRLKSIRDTGLSPSGRVWESGVQTDNLKRTRDSGCRGSKFFAVKQLEIK